MATQGPMVWMDRALKKVLDGTISLTADTFHVVLLTSSQAISATFTGSSADARYADLTAELTTTGGYTVGGVTLTGVTLARVGAPTVTWTSASPSWTFSSALTFKYAAFIDWSATNKDILAFCDMDTGGGSITPSTGVPFAINPDPGNGWLYGVQ